ncbi:hypothetical protein Glove_216g163 [Diversispora epigaea]|uniref:Uncharacterized protein n=1 Tax=Diversispora epigaea TaxID=1348612 RepID=A0A397IK98_9GLOM|nr:hypothetical protein Glove_216g163 [Diversispora epigaea]
MSAIATKIVKKYDLTFKTSVSELSQYILKFLKELTDNRKRNQTYRHLRNSFKFSSDQVIRVKYFESLYLKKFTDVNVAISNKLSKRLKEETIGEMAQRFLQEKLSVGDVRAEAHVLALLVIKVTKFSDITKDTNEIQRDQRIKAEVKRIDYPDKFTLESVKERLDTYDIKTSPNYLALVNIIIMLCLCSAEATTLRITDEGVTGYTKNREQPDRRTKNVSKNYSLGYRMRYLLAELVTQVFLNLVPQHLRKMGAVYGAVSYRAKNSGRLMTLAGECLCHNNNSIISPTQNYVVVNYREKNQSSDQAKPFQIYDTD